MENIHESNLPYFMVNTHESIGGMSSNQRCHRLQQCVSELARSIATDWIHKRKKGCWRLPFHNFYGIRCAYQVCEMALNHG